jgi:hypothetical protein
MALDELHERRLATVINLFEDALDRIELVLESAEPPQESEREPQPGAAEISRIRTVAGRIRERLQAATERFEVNRARPPWRQKLAAELSALWVVAENATPRRMKGYGREFAAQDRADWDALFRDLLHEIERMRRAVTPTDVL